MIRPPRIRTTLWLGLYGALLLVVMANYFLKYPLPDVSAKLVAIFSAIFLTGSAACLGDIVLARLALNNSDEDGGSADPLFDLVVSAGLGLGLLGSVVLILGGGIPGPLRIKLTLLTAALAFVFARGAKNVWGKLRLIFQSAGKFSLLETLAITATGAAMTAALLACFTPITYYDSLVYHLALPALYNRTGAIVAVPSNLYSFFPANTEMLFLYLLNQISEPEYAINMLGWAFTALTGAGIFQWTREMSGRRQGLLALALWWTTPAVLFLSSGAYVEVPLAFMIFLSVRCFAKSLENEASPHWLAVSAIFSGYACAIKYTGALCPAILILFLIARLRSSGGPSPRMLLTFIGITLLPVMPWLIKNFLTVGNPVFPFFYHWFGGRVGWTADNASRYFQMLTEYGAKSNLVYELLLAPWRISSSGTNFGGGFDVLGDFGWPLFIFSVPLATLVATRSKTRIFLFLYLAAHFAGWFLAKPVLRFLVGALPLAAVLTSIVLVTLLSHHDRIVKWAAGLLIVPWLFSNFFMYFFITSELQPFSVSLGLESRSDYLRRRLPFYPMYESINATFKPGDKVLLLGEQRTYHLDVPFVSSNIFALSPLAQWCNSAATDSQLVERKLREGGISHLLISEAEIDRLGGWAAFGFSEDGKRFLSQFLMEKTRQISGNNRLKLFRLSP